MPRKRTLTPEDIAYTIIREWEEDGYKCGEIRNKKSLTVREDKRETEADLLREVWKRIRNANRGL